MTVTSFLRRFGCVTATGLALLPGILPAKPAAATLLMQDGSRRVGYIGKTNDRGVLFQFTENPAEQGTGIPLTEIRAVSFTDEGEIMSPARFAYSRNQWEEAEKLFAGVAQEYGDLFGITRDKLGNFASEARFYQIDCLRRLGRYGEIGLSMDTPTGKNLDAVIPEVLLPKLELLKLWRLFADEKWSDLIAKIRTYEKPLEGEAVKLLGTPELQADSPATVVQLAYMRGKWFLQDGKREEALRDFYRVMTFAYGSDSVLTQNAMREAIAIQAAAPELKGSYPMQMEIHALATVIKDAYGKGEIDVRYRDFTKTPEMPEAMKAQAAAAAQEKAAAATPAPDAAKPAVPAAETSPDAAKPAPPAAPKAP